MSSKNVVPTIWTSLSLHCAAFIFLPCIVRQLPAKNHCPASIGTVTAAFFVFVATDDLHAFCLPRSQPNVTKAQLIELHPFAKGGLEDKREITDQWHIHSLQPHFYTNIWAGNWGININMKMDGRHKFGRITILLIYLVGCSSS